MKVFTRTSKENKRLENNRGASEIIREGHIGEGARPGSGRLGTGEVDVRAHGWEFAIGSGPGPEQVRAVQPHRPPPEVKAAPRGCKIRDLAVLFVTPS
jgi:hypothetical protein